jgi:hypothetical protein
MFHDLNTIVKKSQDEAHLTNLSEFMRLTDLVLERNLDQTELRSLNKLMCEFVRGS